MEAEFCCPETYAVLGEERRSDTWYIPLDAPEILEFLYERKREKLSKSVFLKEKDAHIWDTVAQHQQVNRINADREVYGKRAVSERYNTWEKHVRTLTLTCFSITIHVFWGLGLAWVKADNNVSKLPEYKITVQP